MQRIMSPRPRMAMPVIRGYAIGLLLCACGSMIDETASYDCQAPPANAAACSVDTDCATLIVGCYCGPQPVNGVARVYAQAAQTCENTAASTCALGCATNNQLIAQDGQRVDPGTPIAARCDHAGATGTCRSYVP